MYIHQFMKMPPTCLVCLFDDSPYNMSPRPYRYRPDRRSFDDFTNMFVPIFKDTPPLFLSSILPSTPAMPNGIAAHSKPTTQIYALPPAEILGLESFRQASCIEATIPEPEAALAHQPVAQKKAPAKFALGGSCSSNEQDMTVKMSKSNLVPSPKEGIFQIAGSCRPASTKSDIQPAKPIISEKIKQVIASTSRNSQLKAESAINSDTDDDYVDESAIDDDDDDSDWEDSAEESGESSVDDKFFQRVES
ncbi:uncharacterized protein LMH87_007697 [Akanthomyces muscarius]|uniref:DUF3295 domain-containing protein n=1 Tax=Akanthomyces muscarius TaxID=2231603 RepID=A0A9W8QKQ6_AKAMU|nr:uncharacterized protein LMH87_007697 [Akanthomyces muscarius]KAJ4161671.1 hypothetical protein LMH87_007697 [Akanthomyces muscarius]